MRKLVVIAIVTCAVGAIPASAGATFPAKNGRIAFKRYLDPFRQTSAIFVSGATGKRARQVTHPVKGIKDDQPDWSPDGSKITFERCGPAACEVWVVGADGGGAARIGPDCVAAATPDCESRVNPAFSPDGLIAFGRGYGAYHGDTVEHAEVDVMNVDGTGLRTIWARPPFTVREGSVGWAPDGKRLVLEVQLSSAGTPPNGRALYVINADGTGLRRITPFGLRAGDHPDWSPDGQRILFRSHADSARPAGSQLYTVRPDGTGLRRLTHFAHDETVLSSSVSPDGKRLAVALDGVGGNPDIYTMRIDGTHLRAVTRTSAWDSAPDWGPAN